MNNLNNRLSELYRVAQQHLHGASAEPLNRYRNEAMERFELYGVPTKKDENYLYSDLTKWMSEERFAQYEPICKCDDIVLHQHENGVVVADINTFAEQYRDVFEKYYTKSVEDDAMMMLSRAFATGGRVVYVPANVIHREVITLNNDIKPHTLLLGWRDLLIFEKGSFAKVHITNNNSGVVNRVCEIFLAQGANVEVSEEFSGEVDAVMINTNAVIQARDAYYKHISINLSLGKCRVNEYVTLSEKGCEASVYGAVLAQKNAHIDNSTIVRHAAERCRSYESFKCVAGGEATSVFNGHVYVAAGAQQTEAYQQNNNILLSDSGNIYTKPNLEIYADDVKCSHGATVGQLDEQALFYMRQRGIDRSEARRLLLTGFMVDIVGKISDDTVAASVADKIEQNVCTI